MGWIKISHIPKTSLLLNGCLSILAATMAYLQFGKDNLPVGISLILLIVLISFLIAFINDSAKKQSDAEIRDLTIKLDAANKVHEAQLFELGALRQQTMLLEHIGKKQLEATLYTEELNHKIGNVFFRIKLNNRIPFNDLCPIGFLFEINTRNNTKMKYRAFIEDGKTSRDGLMLESYKKYYIQDDGKFIENPVIDSLSAEIENIVIEFGYPEGLLKDFHDEKLHIYLPENILNQSNFIELVANGRAILHRNVNRSEWSKLDKAHMTVMWPELKHDELELYENWNEDRNIQRYAGWLIDLYRDIPTKYAGATSRWPGF